MKMLLPAVMMCATLFTAAQASATSAFYTTLGIVGADGHRKPGIMIAVGEEDLCDKLHDEMISPVDYRTDWIDSARAFIVVRADRRFPQGKTEAVRPGDLKATATPVATALAYDVRKDAQGKYDFSHLVQRGAITLGHADVVAQAPLPVVLQLDFEPGGPAVEKQFVATYCPAFGALTQLWSK